MLYETLRACWLLVFPPRRRCVETTIRLSPCLTYSVLNIPASVFNPASIAHDGMGLGGDRLEGELSWRPHLCIYGRVVHTGVRLNLGVAVLGPPMCFISKSRLDFEGIILALPSVLCNKGETQDRSPRIPCGSLKFLAVKRGCDW